MAVNDALRAKFLDLKEGAIVVSLQTFKRGGSNVSIKCAYIATFANVPGTQSNDIGRIFEATEKRYRGDRPNSWVEFCILPSVLAITETMK